MVSPPRYLSFRAPKRTLLTGPAVSFAPVGTSRFHRYLLPAVRDRKSGGSAACDHDAAIPFGYSSIFA
jgi:hypothetical protein